ncbi:MAG: DUF6484 domain-containing protein, partial [Fibrobacterota bacterium]|nr:DUF6484 domain-containing protein [Fibrobacterota bacterium]
MTAKKKTSRNPAAALIRAGQNIRVGQEKATPSVDGLLSMMDLSPLDAESTPATPAQASGPRVGKVVGIDSQGRPLVTFAGMAITGTAKNGAARTRSAKSPVGKDGFGSGVSLPARSTVRVTASDTGREALIAFENGDLARPIIIGLLQAPEELPARIELKAGKEMVLKCGPASIT